MKKLRVLITIALFAQPSFCETLRVNCTGKEGGELKSISVVSQIANVEYPQSIKSLIVNGIDQSHYFLDFSPRPYDPETKSFELNLRYGNLLISNTSIEVNHCTNEFVSTGVASLFEHSGAGPIPVHEVKLTCSCVLR